MKRIITTLVLLAITANISFAQKYKWKDDESVIGKWKWSSSQEAFLLSVGNMVITDSVKTSTCLCSPRFTMFLNWGENLNYNFSNNVGFTTGVELKNLGFNYKNDTIRFIARNYYLGVPVYFRLGNFKKRTSFTIGGGVDFAVHYKQKMWELGEKGTKTKNSEWFSDKVNLINPYATIGFTRKGYGLKFNYYFSKFYKNDMLIPNKSIYLPQMVNTNLFYMSLIVDTKAGNKGKKSTAQKA